MALVISSELLLPCVRRRRRRRRCRRLVSRDQRDLDDLVRLAIGRPLPPRPDHLVVARAERRSSCPFGLGDRCVSSSSAGRRPKPTTRVVVVDLDHRDAAARAGQLGHLVRLAQQRPRAAGHHRSRTSLGRHRLHARRSRRPRPTLAKRRPDAGRQLAVRIQAKRRPKPPLVTASGQRPRLGAPRRTASIAAHHPLAVART